VRILIATVKTPFIRGGAEILAEELQAALQRSGHEVELLSMPFRFEPPAEVRRSMDAWAAEDLTTFPGPAIDAVICLKFPTYYVKHPNKIVWLLHQHRSAYELFDTPHGMQSTSPEDQKLRAEIVQRDSEALGSARQVFTISGRVSERLLQSNGLPSTPVYPPVANAESYYCAAPLPYIFAPGRLERLKRQELLLRAVAACERTDFGVIVSGEGGCRDELERLVAKLGLGGRVRLVGHVTQSELLALYANCQAVCFAPQDEDYGFITLESMLASKPVLTCTDSGGPLEFVVHGKTGFVSEPEPIALAGAIDQLFSEPETAAELGRAGRRRIEEMDISWSTTVNQLLEPLRGQSR
jgi:glycosyltransferase involved in cell wall biosynthesis